MTKKRTHIPLWKWIKMNLNLIAIDLKLNRPAILNDHIKIKRRIHNRRFLICTYFFLIKFDKVIFSIHKPLWFFFFFFCRCLAEIEITSSCFYISGELCKINWSFAFRTTCLFCFVLHVDFGAQWKANQTASLQFHFHFILCNSHKNVFKVHSSITLSVSNSSIHLLPLFALKGDRKRRCPTNKRTTCLFLSFSLLLRLLLRLLFYLSPLWAFLCSLAAISFKSNHWPVDEVRGHSWHHPPYSARLYTSALSCSSLAAHLRVRFRLIFSLQCFYIIILV